MLTGKKWSLVSFSKRIINKNECEFIPRSRECDSMPSINLALVKNRQALPSIGLDEPRLYQNHRNRNKLEYLLWLNPFHTWQVFGKYLASFCKYWINIDQLMA